MMYQPDAFSRRISIKRKEIAERLSAISLRIAVLGPNLDETCNTGSVKRSQIADALQKDGHETFFPEHYVSKNDPSIIWVEQERLILSDESVDLVIMLHTDDSMGVLVEIGNFVSVPEINIKTGILFPSQYYKPTQYMPGNTVQGYYNRMQYTEEQLESCELVAECRRWAYTRQIGIWPNLSSEKF